MAKIEFISRKYTIWYLLCFALLYLTVARSSSSSYEQSESSDSTPDGSSEGSQSSDLSIDFLDTSVAFPPPPSSFKDPNDNKRFSHKELLPSMPKFRGLVGEVEEVSEKAVSPFKTPKKKESNTNGSGPFDFIHIMDKGIPSNMPFIVTLPNEPEKIKLRDMKAKLDINIEPEVSFTEYEIGKDIRRDSQFYYELKENLFNDKKIHKEVTEVVRNAEEYRASIDSNIRSLITSVNQIKHLYEDMEAKFKKMKKSNIPEESLIAHEDEIARLKLKYQESYGYLMSEKRKRDAAIDIIMKSKQQLLNIDERIKRTQEKLNVFENQLDIHENSSVPTDELEILQETEIETKQGYLPDEVSIAPHRNDVDISARSYDESLMLEAEESTGVPEMSSQSPQNSQNQIFDIAADESLNSLNPHLSGSPVASLTPSPVIPLTPSPDSSTLSQVSLKSPPVPPPQSPVPSTPSPIISPQSPIISPQSPVPSIPISHSLPQTSGSDLGSEFDIYKFVQFALTSYSSSISEGEYNQRVEELAKRINIINFAMSCIYEVTEFFLFLSLDDSSESSYTAADALKVCRQIWRDSFHSMVKHYVTIPPATLRTLFKTAIQQHSEAVKSLSNFYREDQFNTMVESINIESFESCKTIVDNLFKEADFSEEVITRICITMQETYKKYSRHIKDHAALINYASRIAVYSVIPYSYDTAPFQHNNDLDQMIKRFSFKSLSSSSTFYSQCLEHYSAVYGPNSTYEMAHKIVQEICTSVQSLFSKALPHGVNVVIFSTKQVPTEMIPLFSGATEMVFYRYKSQSDILIPKESSESSLDPGVPADLSPELQLTLNILDQQSKTQDFLQEQQTQLKQILEKPLNSDDTHQILNVLASLNSKQREIERNLAVTSPTITQIISGFREYSQSLPSIPMSSAGTAEISTVDTSMVQNFLKAVENQRQLLDQQQEQLLILMQQPSLSPADRSMTSMLLSDTESRKINLSNQVEASFQSFSMASPLSPESPLSSVSQTGILSHDNSALSDAISNLRILFMEVTATSEEVSKILSGISASTLSPESHNAVNSLNKKIQKVNSKLGSINKRLQKPSNYITRIEDADEINSILMRLLSSIKVYMNKCKKIERSGLGFSTISSADITPPESLSPLLTDSVKEKFPSPQFVAKISSNIVRTQNNQGHIKEFLDIMATRRLAEKERKKLKKLFDDSGERLRSIVRNITRLAANSNSDQLLNFADRFNSTLVDIFINQQNLLKTYLAISGRGENSQDGISINQAVVKLTNGLSEIMNYLGTNKFDETTYSPSPLLDNQLSSISTSPLSPKSGRNITKSPISRFGSSEIVPNFRMLPIESPMVKISAPGQKSNNRLQLPVIPLFRKPHIEKPIYEYNKSRKDSRGVPIVAGPLAGSNVGQKALSYVEKALKRQQTSGIYPQGFKIQGSNIYKQLPISVISPLLGSNTSTTTKIMNRDIFCIKYGYKSMSISSHHRAYRLFAKAPKILPKGVVMDRRSACDIAFKISEVNTLQGCTNIIYPSLVNLGYSISGHRAQKVCQAILVESSTTNIGGDCSQFVSHRTKSKYNFTPLENERATKMFLNFSRLGSEVGVKTVQLSHHTICDFVESMKLVLFPGEKFESYRAYECLGAFEQHLLLESANLTENHIRGILKACQDSGFKL
ncbi:hypothetical protein cand_016360 [Cryptosporidium andersoni]|uniref:Uncharacterized protein n=1 Tax=Cryptosporidium andersoni TaxID=117008 RepID=A0A1J4MWP5_9CRYT|nr:hypothetical protein cand_016360 [Cryptosporidium andersoni]